MKPAPSVSAWIEFDPGLAGGARSDSDVDLSLVVDAPPMARAAVVTLLTQLVGATFDAWRR